MFEQAAFQTKDHITIAGDYYPMVGSNRGVVLVHMMPAMRKSWTEFAKRLQDANYHALAIDLRGHGESGGGDYRNFSDQDHQASIADLCAAVSFLRDKGVNEIFLGGASIGANLSLQYLAENPETRAVFILSPGADYRGIAIAPLSAKIPDKSKILFAGAEDDAEVMGGGCEEIWKLLGEPQKICYKSGGHGTDLFQSHPELIGEIIKFFNKK